MGRVAALGCAVCGSQPVEVHHVIEGRTGNRRSSDWLTIPLCPECHRGRDGIHGTRQAFNRAKTDEMKCLADTLEKIYG